MRVLVNILALVGLVLSVLAVGALYLSMMGGEFTGAAGMVILSLQLYGAIGAAMAVGFGFVGRLMDRRVPLPAGRVANTAIALGLLAGLLLFAAPFVFG